MFVILIQVAECKCIINWSKPEFYGRNGNLRQQESWEVEDKNDAAINSRFMSKRIIIAHLLYLPRIDKFLWGFWFENFPWLNTVFHHIKKPQPQLNWSPLCFRLITTSSAKNVRAYRSFSERKPQFCLSEFDWLINIKFTLMWSIFISHHLLECITSSIVMHYILFNLVFSPIHIETSLLHFSLVSFSYMRELVASL